MKTKVALGVVGFWLLVALVWASQNVLGGALQGSPVAMADALRVTLGQVVPWIPVTLAVIAVVSRWPVDRARWRRTVPLHVLAFAGLFYLQNVLVVIGYWITSGESGTLEALVRSAALWTALRAHVGASAYLAIGAATQSVAYYRAQRARELRLARLEGRLATARLEALVARIRPHFLFNTLHTIGHLWRSGRHIEADAMLDHLGDLFQRVQQNTSRTLVALDDELDMVRAYLAIEQARFGDRLRVEIRADDGTRALAVPPLLLQPLVENAIRHGVAATSTAGHVAVHARQADGRLGITVEDDGPGVCDDSDTRGTGTGLSATRERLAQLFGDAQSLAIESQPNIGTRVRIVLPATSIDAADGAPSAAMHARA